MCSIFDRNYNVNCKYGFDSDYDLEIYTKYQDIIPIIKNSHKYYPLKNGRDYIVKLSNNTDKRCNVTLYIDGKDMGTWRMNGHSSISLERPINSPRKFIFFRENSEIISGLVKAIFVPEYRGGQSMNMDDLSNCEFSSGATVLGNESRERFGNASYIEEDKKNAVTKIVRLVVDKNISYQKNVPIVLIDTLEHELYQKCNCDCYHYDYKQLTPRCCCGRQVVPPRID